MGAQSQGKREMVWGRQSQIGVSQSGRRNKVSVGGERENGGEC